MADTQKDWLQSMNARLESMDARLESNHRENIQIINTFGNAILDRLDAIKNEMHAMNNRTETATTRVADMENRMDSDVIKRIENLEKQVFGKAG